LENGDRLSRAEFERRYEAMPNVKKAELIEGVVYLPSPTRWRSHGLSRQAMSGWLWIYANATPGVAGGSNTTLRLPLDNEPQPDAFLCVLPENGGQVQEDADAFVISAPDLVAEVSASSVSYDLGPKLRLYQRIGVREYVVWRVFDQTFDWFVLHEGQFKPLPRDTDGVCRCKAFPGLWLAVDAMVAGNGSRVEQLLRQGLTSPEHAAFVAQLQQTPPRT
jgi:Uma2 family endonuclease